MNARDTLMAPHAPTPDEAEHAMFLIRWWQEFLGGALVTITGLYLRAKGKKSDSVIVPISEAEIDHKMTICKQGILLALQEELNNRDKSLFTYIEKQDEKMLDHIKDIIKK